MTIPLIDGLELSIFLSLSDDVDSDAFITNNMLELFDESNELAQFVVHEASPRAKRSKLRARFQGHGLRIEDAVYDGESPTQPGIWTHHKLGGPPFFYHQRPYLMKEVDELMSSGWVHLLQMTSIGYRDASVGEAWPFWNQMFHVFAKEDESKISFEYLWA